MKSFQGICLLWFYFHFFHFVCCDPPSTEEHVDFIGSTVQNSSSLLKWVDKKAQVTYVYGVVSDEQWHQFPDLAMTLNLPISQRVLIEYNIQLYLSNPSYFGTRVLIDGVESNRAFRVLTGYTYHHSNQISRQIWLEKGTHTIQIHYKTNSIRNGGQGLEDWSCAVLNVGYYIQ